VEENLRDAGVTVEQVLADGGAFLAAREDASVGPVVPGRRAGRIRRLVAAPHPVRVLRPGGVLAIDNVLSHPDEVAEVLAKLAADPAVVGGDRTGRQGPISGLAADRELVSRQRRLASTQ
jgi:hypothetical protein